MSLTIITINYNNKAGLLKTANSIVSQANKNFEWIIIDGLSTDGSLDVINEFSDDVTYYCSEKDNGIYDAMNKGVKIAKSDWLIMMNSGDVFSSDTIIQQFYELNFNDSVNFIYSDFFYFDAHQKLVKFSTSFEKKTLVHQAVFYRKRLHEKYGYYAVTPKIIVSDYLFFLRIQNEEVFKTNFPICIYDINGTSSNAGWVLLQTACADVVFRRRTFCGMLLYIITMKIKSIIPFDMRNKIKSYIFNK